MIETTIIMTHYAEDVQREQIARQAILSLQPHRDKQTEFILMFNGICPNKKEFIKYCDKYHERPAGPSPGRSINIALKMAHGNIICVTCDDVIFYSGAVKKCVDLIKKYPQFLVTPLPHQPGKLQDVYPLQDGYFGNRRGDDQCTFMTKHVSDDIGPRDEIDPFTDGINYTNRRIAKGYQVLMTKQPLAKDLAFGVHSFSKQMKRLGYKGYKRTRPIYSQRILTKASYRIVS